MKIGKIARSEVLPLLAARLGRVADPELSCGCCRTIRPFPADVREAATEQRELFGAAIESGELVVVEGDGAAEMLRMVVDELLQIMCVDRKCSCCGEPLGEPPEVCAAAAELLGFFGSCYAREVRR